MHRSRSTAALLKNVSMEVLMNSGKFLVSVFASMHRTITWPHQQLNDLNMCFYIPKYIEKNIEFLW